MDIQGQKKGCSISAENLIALKSSVCLVRGCSKQREFVYGARRGGDEKRMGGGAESRRAREIKRGKRDKFGFLHASQWTSTIYLCISVFFAHHLKLGD